MTRENDCEVCFFEAWEPTPDGVRCGHCHLAAEYEKLRARLAEVEAERDEAREALKLFQINPEPFRGAGGTSEKTRTHSLERTSAKGGPFYGRCVYCGKGGLRMSDVTKPCSTAEHPGQDAALIEAVEGHDA